jgi:hypothetical protein
MPEISEQELALLQRSKGLLEQLWGHKDKGQEFKKMVKAIMPDVSIPEVDLVDKVTKEHEERYSQVDAKAKELQDRFDRWEQSQKDKDEEGKLDSRIKAVQKEYGWTDDGIEKVVKRMREQNSADVEAAAAWVAKHEPKPQPAKSSPSYMPEKLNIYGAGEKDDQWADLNKSPERFFDKEVNSILSNPENYREFGGEQ